MDSTQEYELGHQPLDEAVPALPVNPFPSQLNFQYNGAAGIADLLDNALPTGDIEGYAYHNSEHEPQHAQTAQTAQDVYPQQPAAVSHYQNVTYPPEQNYQQQIDLSWQDVNSHQNDTNIPTNDTTNIPTNNNNHRTLWNGQTSWRGEKRKDPPTAHNQSASNAPKEDWICDKCDQPCAYNKVRCMACNRWRGGKRPNMKSTPPILASDLEQPGVATIAALAAEGKWICHNCAAVNHKSRCSVCQSWKGARRHNLPKTYNLMPMDDGPPAVPWACDQCNHMNSRGKSRCSSCQHWKDGKRPHLRAKGHTDVMTESSGESVPPVAAATHPVQQPVYNMNSLWQCKCGRDNTALRCKSCQSWKNCKGQQQYQQQQVAASGMPLVHPMIQNHTFAPWFCNGCNHTNAANSQQCESCSSLRNDDATNYQYNQVHPSTNQMNQYDPPAACLPIYPIQAALPQTYNTATPETQAVHEIQQQQQHTPWVCPHCSRENLAGKARCGGCQKWKGGVRENYKNKRRNNASAETWACHKCNLENSGKKVRCKACQAWKNGGRPDVLARKAMREEACKAKVGEWWPCDRCNRLNKPRNQRCGGCQRWKGGARPQLRKKKASAEGTSQPVQLPPTQASVPQLPPITTQLSPSVEHPPTQDALY